VNLLKKIWKSNFLIRLRSWEYWPFGVLYAPIFLYWLWLSIKARSILYFTVSNPKIENSGMLGESKIKILDQIPSQYIPKTILISAKSRLSTVIDKIDRANIGYPFICKPDVGERGWKVEKIQNEEDLKKYLRSSKHNFLVQEYIDLPLEMGVFYYKYPDQNKGTVSSIVLKEMLGITGDGKSTLRELILNNNRAKLQSEILLAKYKGKLEEILSKNQRIELVEIGNHCLGAKFLNGNKYINPKLNNLIDRISNQVPEFYFGRYDIRVKSIEDLYDGKIKIMELNGAGAEPAHIYEPGFPLFKAYKVIFHHWKVLYEISRINRKRGFKYLSVKQGWKEYKRARVLTS